MELHAKAEIDLAPPPWVTLYQLSQLLAILRNCEVKTYQTRICLDRASNRIAMWQENVGYDSSDADTAGPKHRLVMGQAGFVFEKTIAILLVAMMSSQQPNNENGGRIL